MEEGRVAAAAFRVVSVAWAVVAAEPNQTKLKEADEPNQTKPKGAAVAVAVVGVGEGASAGVALGVLGEAVRAAVLMGVVGTLMYLSAWNCRVGLIGPSETAVCRILGVRCGTEWWRAGRRGCFLLGLRHLL